jgi:hypothetical protein
MSVLVIEGIESSLDSKQQVEISLEKQLELLSEQNILCHLSQVLGSETGVGAAIPTWYVSLYRYENRSCIGVGSGSASQLSAALAAALLDSKRVRNYKMPPRLDSSWLRVAKEKVKLEDL